MNADSRDEATEYRRPTSPNGRSRHPSQVDELLQFREDLTKCLQIHSIPAQILTSIHIKLQEVATPLRQGFHPRLCHVNIAVDTEISEIGHGRLAQCLQCSISQWCGPHELEDFQLLTMLRQ